MFVIIAMYFYFLCFAANRVYVMGGVVIVVQSTERFTMIYE